MKTILLCALLGISTLSYGQARGKGDFISILTHPDEDNNYKVDTTELNTWLDAAKKFYQHSHLGMKTPFLDLSFIEEFDKDKDQDFSSSEERELKEHMKTLFDNAYKRLVEEYDSNKNRRLDTKELTVLREAVPNFFTYAKNPSVGMDKVEQVENFKDPMRIEKPISKRQLDDIYD